MLIKKRALSAIYYRVCFGGAVWSSPTIDLRTRSLLTIVLLAAIGHDQELAMTYSRHKKYGVSADEIREALMHVAIYAGAPAANRAFAVAKRTLGELEGTD